MCNHNEDGINQIAEGGICLCCCEPVGQCADCPAWYYRLEDLAAHAKHVHHKEQQ